MIEYKVRVYDNGNKYWLLNGKLHREDGPAIERADGSKSWFLNDNLHREDGPAIEGADGRKSWLLNGKLHREDGPAVEGSYGFKFWYLNGKLLTEQEFNKRMKKPCSGKLVEIEGVKYKLVEAV